DTGGGYPRSRQGKPLVRRQRAARRARGAAVDLGPAARRAQTSGAGELRARTRGLDGGDGRLLGGVRGRRRRCRRRRRRHRSVYGLPPRRPVAESPSVRSGFRRGNGRGHRQEQKAEAGRKGHPAGHARGRRVERQRPGRRRQRAVDRTGSVWGWSNRSARCILAKRRRGNFPGGPPRPHHLPHLRPPLRPPGPLLRPLRPPPRRLRGLGLGDGGRRVQRRGFLRLHSAGAGGDERGPSPPPGGGDDDDAGRSGGGGDDADGGEPASGVGAFGRQRQANGVGGAVGDDGRRGGRRERSRGGGDRSSDWGGWRRTRGGWCSATRDDDDGPHDREHEGRGIGGGGGGGGAPGYFGGLVSSLGVWLGFKSVALEDCLDAFFSPERLRGANQYHCDGCGCEKEAGERSNLLHAPEILMLHVKRFRRGYLWSHKVHNRVVFPLHDLDVSRWLSDHAVESSVNQQRASGTSGGDAHRKSSVRRGSASPDGGGYYGGGSATAAAAAAAESVAAAFSPSSPAPVLYDLVGLVEHTGGLEHGHYTSYTRDDGSATWHHFNDTITTKVSQETVSSASPYILVYRRKRPSSSWGPGTQAQSMRPGAAPAVAAATAAAAATASLLASVGIGPAAEEARDVRSRVDIMAREMAKAAGGGHRPPSLTAATNGSTPGVAAAVGGTIGAEAVGEPQPRLSIGGGGGGGGGGGVSDTDGEGGGGPGRRASVTRRRKGRGRRPGSESESEGGTGGSNSATKEMVAVPRGVHRSLVNRYGPRTPAVVAGKPSPLDATTGGVKVAVAPGESADRISVGRGRGRGQGMALVGSSRPLLELTSCTACAALEEERALLKSAEQKE
ncbi:unnamed protein product, partial [Ectocarpus sp. 8 AP-2014]